MARIEIVRERVVLETQTFVIDTDDLETGEEWRLFELAGRGREFSPAAHPDGHLMQEFLDDLLDDHDPDHEDHWELDGFSGGSTNYEIQEERA